MEFCLNGETVTYNDDKELSLLFYLRNIALIKTQKDGCSGQGVCGACTVIMENKAVLACKVKMSRVEGKNVITIDGLQEKIQEVFAKAFVEEGGIQCGFCTPGIVMSASALLIKNPDPTIKEIKRAIHKNICRCTGYKKIISSIKLAASLLKEDNFLEKNCNGKIGERLGKYDAFDTVLGKRPFVCDFEELGMYYGALKFSDYPRALIKSIDLSVALKVKGVIKIIVAEDIPGERYGGAIKKDWPLMIKTGEETRYIGDVLAGVVAISEKVARKAVSKIMVDYDVRIPLTNVDDSMRENEYKIHSTGNILSTTKLIRGNAKSILNESKYVTSGTYYTQRIEHAFLETESCFAICEGQAESKKLKIYSQGQGAYEDRQAIARILDVEESNINIIQIQNGGGFGGKEDISVQGHASLFSWITERPVKVSFTREESMCFHPKRHPMRLKYQLGCDELGKLTGLIVEIDGDTGAYASVGMKVLERAAGHAAGAYVVPNIDLVARAVYTNNIPCGAMRGFGVNQAAFAIEGCIDELCRMGNFERWQFRYNNAVREGERLVTGQLLIDGDGVGLRPTLEALKDVFQNAKYAGIACGIKNTGVGNGMPDTTKCKIVIKEINHIIIYHGWSEMGQGVHTMAQQFLCEELSIDPSIIEVLVDTNSETVCGMTTSSRGTSLVGKAIQDACKKIKKDLEKSDFNLLVGREYWGEWICDWTTAINEEKEGDEPITHYSYGYATQVVTLDDSGKIDKIYAAHDAGKVINPTLFEGQIEGAVHMGLGFALSENFQMKDGYPINTNLGKLGILRAKDMPEIEVIAVEASDRHGPHGAKGVGEIGLVPTAAAVANALYTFDRKRRFSLPIGINKKFKKG